MNDVLISLPLNEVERRALGLLGSLRPDDDDGAALTLLAKRVQRLHDAGGLGIGTGPEIVRGLAMAEDALCLMLASRPAAGRQSIIDRAHLFRRHRGRSGSRVALFLLSALESDRRRLGVRSKDLDV